MISLTASWFKLNFGGDKQTKTDLDDFPLPSYNQTIPNKLYLNYLNTRLIFFIFFVNGESHIKKYFQFASYKIHDIDFYIDSQSYFVGDEVYATSSYSEFCV